MRSLWVAPVLALAMACEKIDYIELVPSDVEFKNRGDQKALVAKCMSRAGKRAEKAQVGWSVKDPSIAEVSPKGVLKPLKSGSTEVIAKYGDIEAAATVRVALVEKIEVVTPPLVVKEGAESVTIVLKYLGLGNKDLGTRSPAFSVRDKKVATIVGGNAVLPLDPGQTVIDIQVDGVKASLDVTVEADKTQKKK